MSWSSLGVRVRFMGSVDILGGGWVVVLVGWDGVEFDALEI